MLNRVRSAAGNAPVGAAATFPMQADRDGTTNVDFLTGAPDPNQLPSSRYRVVTPGFLEAMGTKVVAGRTFAEDDRGTTQPVALVNRAFARKFLPEANPIGSALRVWLPCLDRANPAVIVGVIGDIRYKAVSEEAEPTFYLPQGQLPFLCVASRWSSRPRQTGRAH